MSEGLPLDGLRVLDLTRHLPGPYATLVLADLGAQVDKLEEPSGDPTRALPYGAPLGASYFAGLNRAKRSLVLDLKAKGGAAALLASPTLEADAMVLEMVYPTINQAISDRLTARFGRWSGALTPVLTWQLKPRLGISANLLRPIDRVGSIHAAKLFISGSEDQYTTLEESRQMFAAASEPKALWVVSGARHEDLCRFASKEYEQRVLDFFCHYLKRGPESIAN